MNDRIFSVVKTEVSIPRKGSYTKTKVCPKSFGAMTDREFIVMVKARVALGRRGHAR
jgi:hypothetical protein